MSDKKGICRKCNQWRWLKGKVCKPCDYPIGDCLKCTHHGKIYVDGLCYCCYQHRRVSGYIDRIETEFKPKNDYNSHLFRLYLLYIRRYRLFYIHIKCAKKLADVLECDLVDVIKSWSDIYQLSQKYKIGHSQSTRKRCVMIKIGHMLEELKILSPKDSDCLFSRRQLATQFSPPLKDHVIAYDHWLSSKARTDSTIINNLTCIRYFHDWLTLIYPCFTFTTVNESKAKEYLNQMATKAKPSQVRTAMFLLRRFYDFLIHRKILLHNPFNDIGVGEQPKRIIVISDYHIIRLAKFVSDPMNPPEDALTLTLLLFYGFKTDDIVNAKVSIVSDQLSIVLRQRERSYGRRYHNRNQILQIPIEPAWLSALSKRFIKYWRVEYQKKTKSFDNPHLILARHHRHCRAISHMSFVKRVKAITEKVTGVKIPPKVLRQTAGHIYSTKAGDGWTLSRLGWSPDFAFHYTWLPREIYSEEI